MGDFIQTPLTPEFDAVHAFAVVRGTLTMYQRALAAGGAPATVPWQWNTPTVADPIQVFPRHSNMQNAFYSRTGRLLAFGFFPKAGATIFTCRSLDIVAHETGHAVLDGLKPNWLLSGNPPQTGALHEAFGDLTAIFFTLSQLDQVEAVIAQTKANLHNKTFLADLAEEFGRTRAELRLVRHAEIVVHALDELQQPLDFLADLLGHDETVTVVLRELTHARQSRQHARQFVAVQRRLLVESNRQLAVAVRVARVEEVVAGAVHGL